MKLNVRYLNWGALLAVLALVGLAAFHFLTPMPAESDSGDGPSLSELEEEQVLKQADYEKAEARLAELTWQVARDEVDPTAMAWVVKQGQATFVEVQSIRPQRIVELEGLDELNYLVTAEGSFPNIMRFIDTFESEDSLLAVKIVQITSLSGASDLVRASIGLVAYQERPKDET